MMLLVSLWTSTLQAESILEPEDTWTSIFLHEQKVGYEHEVIETVQVDGTEKSHIRTEIVMRANRLGRVFEVRKENLAVFTADGFPESLMSVLIQDGKTWRRTEGRFAHNKLYLTVTTPGETKNLTLDVPADFADGSIVVAQMKREGLRVGQKRTFTAFSESELAFSPVILTVTAQKEVDFKGQNQEVLIIHTLEMLSNESFENETWVSLEGKVLQSISKTSGMRYETTSKEEALEEPAGMEAFFSFMVSANTTLPSAQDITRLKVRVSVEDGIPERFFPTDSRQRFGAGDVLVVQSQSFTPKDSLKLPIPSNDELTPFLLPSRYIESNDTELTELSQQIVTRETNAWRAAQLIAKWVSTNLQEAYDVAFASAKEALELGRGDCTEHALLFAGLARAAKIPTKVCSGLTYTGVGAFQYHAWNEVYVGQWVAIDPVLNQTRVDATHLKMFEGALSDEQEYARFGLKLLAAKDTLRLSVLEYRAGETIVDATQGRFLSPRIEHNTYTNYEYGIRISKPNEKWVMTMDTIMPAMVLMMAKRTVSTLPPNVSLMVQRLPQQIGLQEYGEQLAEGVKMVSQQYQQQELRQIQLKGKQALEHTYAATIQGNHMRGKQLCFLLQSNTMLILTFTAQRDGFDAYEDEFQQILDSLELFGR